MKTIIITLFLLVIGFFQFYFSDPDIDQAIHVVLCLLCVFSIGMLVSNRPAKQLKTDEEVDKIASMAVKDVAAVAMDNVSCRLRIIELEAQLRQLKNDVTNRDLRISRNIKQISELKHDIQFANHCIKELNNPIIQETC